MREIPDLLGHVGFVERQLSAIANALEDANTIQRRILATLDRQAAALDRLAAAAEKLASTPSKAVRP